MTRHTKRVIGAVAIVLLVFAVFVAIVLTSGALKRESPIVPDAPPAADSQQDDTTSADTPQKDDEPTSDDIAKEEAEALDPTTLGTLAITPASLSISYVKGVGGFEYEVLRTTDGRRYVELSNSRLIGTKCSNDSGVFVSIVESPNESEKATIARTVRVDGVQYGLSVASPTCTGNPELLQQYQDAFTRPFGLLKKL